MNTGGRPPSELDDRKLGGVELGVELGKFLAVAPAGERRQTARLSRLPAAEARPGIARPRAVIDGAKTRLAELAIVDHIDAEFRLLAADLLDRGRQPFGVKLLVIGLAGKFGAVDFEQRLRPRQAPGMRCQNASVASLHGIRPSQTANPVLRIAARRRGWLMPARPPPAAGPTAKTRGLRGCEEVDRSASPRGNGAQLRDDRARFVELSHMGVTGGENSYRQRKPGSSWIARSSFGAASSSRRLKKWAPPVMR